MSQYNDINCEIEGVFRELYEYSRYARARIDEASHEISQKPQTLEPHDILFMYANAEKQTV